MGTSIFNIIDENNLKIFFSKFPNELNVKLKFFYSESLQICQNKK